MVHISFGGVTEMSRFDQQNTYGVPLKNIRDQVIPVLRLLETTKSHLGTWDIFFGVL